MNTAVRINPEPYANLRQADSREEVRGDPLKERDVVREELWKIDVDDGAEHKHVLVLLGEVALQVARRAQHRHHGAHAVIVARHKDTNGA